ncbi:hypothetical protein OCT63_18265 [Vibrio sp. RW]|uniref:hypothetical protein n=1 Tax=Vibrio sp. RW TaxID=2998833 RepID=UPI0022CD7F9A|nr:hypothetical protein [Vibrio sp. RW]MDA0146174.1 hypothetical protein [Vibrio sp. RW]
MNINDTIGKLEKANLEFQQFLNKHQFRVKGVSSTYDLVIDNILSEKVINASLIGTYAIGSNLLVMPYHLVEQDPQTMLVERSTVLGLKEYGHRINMPELTENKIFFCKKALAKATAWRRMTPPRVYRNEKGHIASVFPLNRLIATAAHYYRANAFVAIKTGQSIVYLAIHDDIHQLKP